MDQARRCRVETGTIGNTVLRRIVEQSGRRSPDRAGCFAAEARQPEGDRERPAHRVGSKRRGSHQGRPTGGRWLKRRRRKRASGVVDEHQKARNAGRPQAPFARRARSVGRCSRSMSWQHTESFDSSSCSTGTIYDRGFGLSTAENREDFPLTAENPLLFFPYPGGRRHPEYAPLPVSRRLSGNPGRRLPLHRYAIFRLISMDNDKKYADQ